MSSTGNEFLQRLRVSLRDGNLANSRVLVAVSGGADSVALLRGLLAVSAEFELSLIVAHCNHGLRGADSDEDAQWVQELATKWQLPAEAPRLAVTQRVAQTGETLEEAARALRYAALTDIATRYECSCIAVGHTADDQAETVLHHVLRGTGLAGLRGIPRTRRLSESLHIVRPLLNVTRDQVEAFLRALGQGWRCDASNADATFTRNRLRHELLPQLERDFNPRVRRALTQLATQADEVATWMRTQAESLLEAALVSSQPDCLRLDISRLQQAPRCVVREALLVAWQTQHWPLQSMGFAEWERLADLLDGGSAFTLPGHVDARRRGQLLVLTRSS